MILPYALACFGYIAYRSGPRFPLTEDKFLVTFSFVQMFVFLLIGPALALFDSYYVHEPCETDEDRLKAL